MFLNTMRHLFRASRPIQRNSMHTHVKQCLRYHFAHHTPIYVVPIIGYVLMTREEGSAGTDNGFLWSICFNDKVRVDS